MNYEREYEQNFESNLQCEHYLQGGVDIQPDELKVNLATSKCLKMSCRQSYYVLIKHQTSNIKALFSKIVDVCSSIQGASLPGFDAE